MVVVVVIVVVVVVPMIVLMIVVVPAAVSIEAVPVPLVIVIDMAMISIPISCIKLLSIMARFDPMSPLVRRACPITVMPLIAMPDRIPIAVDKCVTGARAPRHNANHTRTWRRTNSNADRDLRLRHRCAGQQQGGE